MSGSYLSAIRISIPQTPIAAGDAIKGSVRLDLRVLGEERVGEVRTNLRGILHSSIKRNGRPLTDTIYLVKQSTSVWRRGMPSSSSDILKVPFKFRLPDHLPPSFDFSDSGDSVRISYTVEAVPDRSSTRSTRVEAALTVVPDDPVGVDIKSGLESGWIEAWTGKTAAEHFQRTYGLVGDVTMNLLYPSLPSIPVRARFPFTLDVTTVSSPMLRNDDERIWPSPPTHPREVLAELQQRVHIRIGSESRTYTSPAQSLWGGTTDVGPFVKDWLPSEGDATAGKWKQDMTFRSSFSPLSTPTFRFERVGASEVHVEYSLRINVHFGPHHSLELDIPVVISSGLSKSRGDPPASIVMMSVSDPVQQPGLDSRLSQVELPMSWFRSAHDDTTSSNSLRRVITAPETGPSRARSTAADNSEVSGRLQEYDLPMDYFMTDEESASGVPSRSNAARGAPSARTQGHGYTRSLELLDNSIALMNSELRPGGRHLGVPASIPLRPVRSASPGARRVRNYGAADVPV
ncbi:hypothetical protein DAEQUDRAFT_276022 [Daedalea quercina L-15889]|uniref:Arrestin-like N-terminal domain-containing protein n=1 Tax=Daedalea quercina L-15889 TaxID=1314783 RepID=A0A165Q7C4_9APHY|nr:hypothetical protein DAEQUDRAFT_276022 [Daedalea quercina L-15889]